MPLLAAPWTFRRQYCICVDAGVSQKMTEENYALMSRDDKDQYENIAKFWGLKPFEGGPGCCGVLAGICSAKHCRKVLGQKRG